MKYIGILNDNVIVAKGISYTDYVDNTEIELTKEQYNSIPVPCKLVNGEFVPCDFPEVETPTTEPEPTPQDDTDAMLIDHEYRLTLLELGVIE